MKKYIFLIIGIAIIALVIYFFYPSIIDPENNSDNWNIFSGNIVGAYDRGNGYIHIALSSSEGDFYMCEPPCSDVTELVTELNNNKGLTLTLEYYDDSGNWIYKSHTID